MVEWGDKRSQDIKQAATATILSGTLMRDATDSITDAMRIVNIGGSTASPRQEPWAATAQLHSVSDFESVLLAIAGHDLRQPLQIVQSAYELLGMGLRTSAELGTTGAAADCCAYQGTHGCFEVKASSRSAGPKGGLWRK
jgi:hypothetical protein